MTTAKLKDSLVLRDALLVGKIFLGNLILSLILLPFPEKRRDHLLYLSLLVIPFIWLFFNSIKPNPQQWVKRKNNQSWSLPILILSVLIVLKIGSWKADLISALLAMTQIYYLPGPPLAKSERNILFVFLTSLWIIVGKLSFWHDHNLGGFVLEHPYNLIISFGMMILFSEGLAQEVSPSRRPDVEDRFLKRSLLAILIGILTILVAAVPPGETSAHHWSFFTGPAELVRTGGWLLYDVPSQYGLLNIMLLAILPGRDSYANLHFIQIVFYVIIATLFFAIWTELFKSKWSRILAIPSILTLIYFVPGWIPDLTGPLACPSVGPFRFLFAELLLGIIFFSRSKSGFNLLNQKSWIFIAHVTWLIGVFWSAESAIYCTLTWIPAYLLLVWDYSQKKVVSQAVCILLTPAIAFLSLFSAISIFYQVKLGRWPDWSAYIEYALTYSNGFGSLPISYSGTVWLISVEFLVLAIFFVSSFVERATPWKKAVTLSSLFLFWSTLSYYATRSHENNTLNLLSIHVLCLLTSAATLTNPFQTKTILRWSYFLPILVVSSSLTIGNPNFFNTVISKIMALKTLSTTFPTTGHPELPPEAQKLLSSSTYQFTDPICYLGQHLLIFPAEIPRVAKNWLPIAPYAQFTILSSQRKSTYMSRWTAHLGLQSGYLLFSKAEADGSYVQEQITQQGYVQTHTWRNGVWELIQYQSKGPKQGTIMGESHLETL
jgi:hypothetical protein